jgi:hypothetical protein
MNFGKREIIIAGGAILVIVAVVIAWTWKPRSDNPVTQEGTWWICNDDAHHEFNVSAKALADYREKNWGQPVKCPTCGKESKRAEKCQHCGKVYVLQRTGNKCPQCGKTNEPKP